MLEKDIVFGTTIEECMRENLMSQNGLKQKI